MEGSKGHKEKAKKVTWNHMVKYLKYFMTDWIHVEFLDEKSTNEIKLTTNK